MPRARTVIDYLADLPDDQLRRMREETRKEVTRVQAEATRLGVELHQIDEALAKKQRDGARSGRLTAQQVLDVVKAANESVTVADVVRLLAEAKVEASTNAVRNHLNRLHEKGELLRDGDRYDQIEPAVNVGYIPTSPTDDDIPF